MKIVNIFHGHFRESDFTVVGKICDKLIKVRTSTKLMNMINLVKLFFFSCESSKWCQCSNSHFLLNKPLEKLSSLWPLNFNIWSCLKTLPCLRNFPKFGFIFRKKIAVSLFTFVSANRSKFELGKISKISKIQKQKNKTNWDKSKLRIWFFNL